MFKIGQIRRSKENIKYPLVKLLDSPITEIYINNELQENSTGYVVMKTPIRKHYFVLISSLKSFINQETFWIVHMITHSEGFNNIKLESEWLNSTNQDIDNNSMISADKFAIPESVIDSDKLLGELDLEKYYQTVRKFF